MITTPVPHPTDTTLDLPHLLQASTTRTASKEKSKAAKRKRPTFIASVSHADTAVILQSIKGVLRLVLMWGTNTPENAENPDEGAYIDHAFGITCEELDARAWDDPYVLRQGTDWKLEADVCDVFAEFLFTPERGEPVTLSVSMDILRALEGIGE